MPLEVGTNSYISVEDADAYFLEAFIREPDAALWPGLSEEDKGKVLIAATRRIERLTFVGRRKEALQSLQFPRCYATSREPRDPADALAEDGLLAHYRGDPVRWECEEAVPKAVLDAVCEEALALLKSAGDAQGDLRSKLQRQGVSSVKIGSTSESYSGAGPAELHSTEAEQLLAPYLASVSAFG